MVLSAVATMLLFSGCGTKQPSIDSTAANSAQGSSTASNSIGTANATATLTPSTISATASTNSDSTVIPPITNINSKEANSPVSKNGNNPLNASNSVSVNGGTNSSSANSMVEGINGSDGSMVSIFFDYDKFDIREDMQESMNKNSALVKGKTIKIEGNCDEFGSDEYNVALGLKRANAVKTELVNAGINPDLIGLMSLGESNPVCLDKTQECWAKNRRVDFKLP